MSENDEMVATREQIEPSFEEQIEPSVRQQIEQRAYEIYLERGATDGDDMADWLSAEEEVTGLVQRPIDSPAAVFSGAPDAMGEDQMARAEEMLRDLYERSRAIAARAGS
jgi:Protein of unknown function (DUF2934)